MVKIHEKQYLCENKFLSTMKKTLLFLAALAMLVGCGNNKQNNKPEPKQDSFTVETYDVQDDRLYGTEGEGEDTYEIRGSFQCEIDIPVTDNQALRDSICDWFAQHFGSDNNENPRDVKAMVNHFKNGVLEPDEEAVGFDCGYTVKMLEATDRYVTYSFETFYEEYSQPRAAVEVFYRTFDRNTGKAFTSQMIKADESLEMLVMNALLEQYFRELYGDDDISDLLFFDPEDLEEQGFWLPQVQAPCIVYDEVHFNYGEHEIADRCTGRPSCSLPYSVMEPYLTEEGKAFFK